VKTVIIIAIAFVLLIPLPVFAPSHPEYVGFDRPLKQIAQGIAPEDVTCNKELVLIIKNNDMSACVRPDTAVILEERGWGYTNNVDVIDIKQSSIDSVLFGGCGPIATCDTFFLITQNTITYFPPNELEPDFSIDFEFSQTEFNELTGDLEPSHLLSLPEKSGCMGCDDGPWTLIEFKIGNITKTIQFDDKSRLPILDNLADKLWPILEKTQIQYDISRGLITDEINILVDTLLTSQQIQELDYYLGCIHIKS